MDTTIAQEAASGIAGMAGRREPTCAGGATQRNDLPDQALQPRFL